ncbi:putative 6-phosphogluconolactonase 4, chloroplastic [Iris pallida]|uniref:6-phosphogluconolactonase n=1 Tax=Iris pallida TaxID=29817 RepID=A0AAX6GSW5_IRIPA|nr:putative 6-phosphogluconolactonase 4, chloroplastic [Iris pallida]KAJ6831425.1 putative 6-phosphogluconolactonase 4, chloroplastic [Iris pallida]
MSSSSSSALLSSHLRHLQPPPRLFPANTLPLPRTSLIPPTRIRNPTRSLRIRSSSMAAAATAKEAPSAKEKDKVSLLVFDSEEDLSVSLAKYTAELSGRFAGERGAFSVVISGGSLIKSLRKLVEAPYADSVEWGKWHVFWVDERVVPKDHPDSNYKLAYDAFLSKVPIPPGHVYAINDSLSAEGAADDYETCLKQLVKTGTVQLSPSTGFPKFDLMLLGMGPDGHVASLFPGHPLLQEKERWITFIKDSPKPPSERITFTFPVINSSANIALVATGAGKAGVLHQAFGDEHSTSELLPVQMVTLEDGELTWFADKAAASKVQDKANL